YRTALHLRRKTLGLGDGSMRWVDTPAGSLGLERDEGFLCLVNLTADPLHLPAGEVLVASGDLDDGRLPSDTAVWISR
ncbi:MAG: DUF3459 domain-containing protein, partial [Nocardioidaceae bacterium]